MAKYSSDFYEGIATDGVSTARAVVPLVLDLVGPVRSVLDLGCGVGAWLSVFKENGGTEVLGVDGDYVPRDQLLIDASEFSPADLSRGAAAVHLDRHYDLAMSTEVAEHLPDAVADEFVGLLTSAAPVVLFSAAVPGQGGTGHINEQWPEYWAEKFAERGHTVIDAIRPELWTRPDVSSCIVQNVLLYVRDDLVEASAGLRRAAEATRPGQLSVVHPRRYDLLADPRRVPFRRAVASLPGSLVGAVGRRMNASWARREELA